MSAAAVLTRRWWVCRSQPVGHRRDTSTSASSRSSSGK